MFATEDMACENVGASVSATVVPTFDHGQNAAQQVRTRECELCDDHEASSLERYFNVRNVPWEMRLAC